MGGVDGDDSAVAAADAVTALPTGEEQRLDDAGADARGVRPGGELGEGFADDLVGRVAEEVFRVLVPGGYGAGSVDLDDGDPDPFVGDREERVRDDGAGGPGAHGAVGQVELEPDLFVRRGVVDAPA